MALIQELLKELKESEPSKNELSKLKMRLCKKYGIKRMPPDYEILLESSDDSVRPLLLSKPMRSASGVAPIAIMTEPASCPHGTCAMCPGGPGSHFGDVPQSYTGHEPASMRAARNRYDPYLQIFNRLEQYIILGHQPQKVEIIIMGGTFPALPESYQESFITSVFQALNDFSSHFFRHGRLESESFRRFFELPAELGDEERTRRIQRRTARLKSKGGRGLQYEQGKNERSQIRCVGLTVETRPDYGMEKEGKKLLELGCTRVELGVQSTSDRALAEIDRGHTVQDSVRSARILRELGFKLNFHMMLGLPGVTRKEEVENFKQLFSNPDFRPDMLKIYPCMVIPGTPLHRRQEEGRYSPLTTAAAVKLIADIKEFIPRYVRVMRVQRDIPTKWTSGGVSRTNLRQYVAEELSKRGSKCECIRCREIRGDKPKGRQKLNVMEYEAAGGTEYFISLDDEEDRLLGFCRLRLGGRAIVRELHVYGEAAALGKTGPVQHRGYGKRLLSKAENIAKSQKRKSILVISGVGVRDYYRRLGYRRSGPYMVKGL